MRKGGEGLVVISHTMLHLVLVVAGSNQNPRNKHPTKQTNWLSPNKPLEGLHTNSHECLGFCLGAY